MVRGITNFIQQSPNQLLRPHKLRNTYLIIDGKNISFQLHLQNSRGREFFGGDYDSYARCVTAFFDALIKCQITPIVVFDGNNEEKKLNTNFDRYNKRFRAATNYLPAIAGSGDLSVFPLFLRTVFTDVVNKMDVLVYRCEFAADNEIAGLGRELNAPILSQDSDYYIYDVLYVPFSSLKLTPQTLAPSSDFYLSCELYSCKYFLNAYPGLRWEHMTLIATVSGNDYIESDVFEDFYSQLCKQRGRAARLKSLINFLRNKSFEVALSQIMNSLHVFDKKKLAKQIAESIICYQYKQSVIPKALKLKNFKLDESLKTDVCASANLTALVCSALKGLYTEGNLQEIDLALQKVNLSANQVDGFLQNNQMCFYPAPVFEIAFSIMYFFPAILENSENSSVHTVSYKILSAINKIISQTLKGKEVPLKVVGRQAKMSVVQKFELDTFKDDIVCLKDISDLTKDEKLDVLLNVLDFKSDKNAILEMFAEIPSDWHLFFVCLMYWKANAISDINDDHLKSIYLCAIILKIVDKAVGVERSLQELSSKYADILNSTAEIKPDKSANVFDTISKSESVFCLREFIPKFQYDTKYKFDKKVVHAFAEIQSCIYFINSLNALLDCPLEKILISEFYNDTFLFNVYHAFCQEGMKISLETVLPAINAACLRFERSMKNILKK